MGPESWSDPWKGSAATHRLATLPAYVDLVYLSFMYPDATYTGGVTWAGTGIQFSSDPAVVKGAVALLKQRNPRTKVLVAVGGATYTAWDKLNAASIKRFVDEFGLDGVDIDYEPSSAGCSFPPAVPAVRCSIDAEFTRVVTALRSAFPAPRYLLTSAVWSIGAYGQGAWVNSQPQGDHTGQSVNMLSAFGDQLDILNVMSYDAGPTYKPKEALDAYRSLFKGRILMGVEVPPES
ncbi:chitinase [Micractinium conductrix]|uniref:Chitinase n=1 Tax=Micractinium conductrix TaxID=554055 RepID=A0A2P6UYV7_9CHLO|nr:chitinase [Micractinium conductrix]|eukprot:PSC67018.1 chitinase [Micractinium conductrix]